MKFVRIGALIGFVAMMALVPAGSSAQTPGGQQPGIAATGTGTASEPANSARLQFQLGSAAYFGMTGMMMETIEAGPGTPAAIGPEMMDPFGLVDEDAFTAVVQALVNAGAAEDAIEVTFPVASGFMGPGSPEVGEIIVVVDQPNPAMLVALVEAVRETAPSSELAIVHTGASYEPADCATLLQTARDAAIADAQQRAEGLATSLGVTLGELIQASESPYYGSPEGGSCAPAGTEFYGPYGPGTLAAFDARSIEAKVTVQVTLTYAVGTGG